MYIRYQKGNKGSKQRCIYIEFHGFNNVVYYIH